MKTLDLLFIPTKADESQAAEAASLFPSDSPPSPHERRIFAADEATHIDEIVERLEPEWSFVRDPRGVV